LSGQHHCVGEYEIKDLSLQRPQRLCHHKGWGLHVRKGHRGCWHSRSKKRKTSVRLSSLQDRNGVGTPARLIFTGESGPPATLVRWRARGLNRHRFAGGLLHAGSEGRSDPKGRAVFSHQPASRALEGRLIPRPLRTVPRSQGVTQRKRSCWSTGRQIQGRSGRGHIADKQGPGIDSAHTEMRKRRRD